MTTLVWVLVGIIGLLLGVAGWLYARANDAENKKRNAEKDSAEMEAVLQMEREARNAGRLSDEQLEKLRDNPNNPDDAYNRWLREREH